MAVVVVALKGGKMGICNSLKVAIFCAALLPSGWASQSEAATLTHEVSVRSIGSGDYLVSDPSLDDVPTSGAVLMVNGTAPFEFGPILTSSSPGTGTVYETIGFADVRFLSITNSGSEAATSLTFSLLVGYDFRYVDMSAYPLLSPPNNYYTSTGGLESTNTIIPALCTSSLLPGQTCYQGIAATPVTRGGSTFDIGKANDYAIISYESMAAVPLPAGLPMLASVLLGLGVLSRRKKIVS